jgi:hypothetical protein
VTAPAPRWRRVPGKSILTWAAIAGAFAGCGGGAEAGSTGAGVANVKVADFQWQIEGTCEVEGDDVTFNGRGDPRLSIGFNPTTPPFAVGNLSSQREGLVILIGTDEAPAPEVTVSGGTYTAVGKFAVPGETLVAGEIEVHCL